MVEKLASRTLGATRRKVASRRVRSGPVPLEQLARTPDENPKSPPVDLGNFGAKTAEELLALAAEYGIKELPPKRSDLVMKLLAAKAEETGTLVGAGVLDLIHDGSGFLRTPYSKNGTEDIYVHRNIINQHRLRKADFVAGPISPPKQQNSRHYFLQRPEVVCGTDPETARSRPTFDKLTSVYPNQQINLETQPKILSTRIIDIAAPIGKGQRALIVAPPKAGKTIILKEIAAAVAQRHPDVHIIVALIGERPEEVTDMRRSVKGEVYSSTFDEPAEDHCKTARVALERSRRLVEAGEDVVLLLDSLTRLARAYNVASPSSGKTMSGGMDPAALYPPKMFFGAARNCEEGGSLTIVATALVDTGSRLDDVIYEEFKGTGNMELHLNRRMADRRIFPAIEMEKSGTRHEELLMDSDTLKQVWLLRRMLGLLSQGATDNAESAERIIERLKKTKTNREFLATIGLPEKG